MRKSEYLSSLLEPGERLKRIKGFSGRYYITNKARVLSCRRLVSGKFKISVLNPANYGKKGAYQVVHLYNEGGSKTYYLHKLLQQYFKIE